ILIRPAPGRFIFQKSATLPKPGIDLHRPFRETYFERENVGVFLHRRIYDTIITEAFAPAPHLPLIRNCAAIGHPRKGRRIALTNFLDCEFARVSCTPGRRKWCCRSSCTLPTPNAVAERFGARFLSESHLYE